MIGQTISHYKVLEKIGEGGMGQVYLAEDTSLERKVALKFLPLGLQTDPVAHKRFIREAKSAAAIEHPYICNIKEVAQTEDGQDFMVMEYVEGQTLKGRLEKGASTPHVRVMVRVDRSSTTPRWPPRPRADGLRWEQGPK